MSFPAGLSAIEFGPFLPMDGARSDAGDVWWTMDADAYWQGNASTTKLNPALQANWDGFMLAAMFHQTAVEFTDPRYRLPSAYRSAGVLPGGFDGEADIADLADPLNPVISGLPVGLELKRGDRIGVVSVDNKTLHVLAADVTVASSTAQVLPVLPPILDNVFSAGDQIRLIDPAVRLTVVPNSWSVRQQARSEPIGTFQVVEASVV